MAVLGQGIAWIPDGDVVDSPGMKPLKRVLPHVSGETVLRASGPQRFSPVVNKLLEAFEVAIGAEP